MREHRSSLPVKIYERGLRWLAKSPQTMSVQTNWRDMRHTDRVINATPPEIHVIFLSFSLFAFRLPFWQLAHRGWPTTIALCQLIVIIYLFVSVFGFCGRHHLFKLHAVLCHSILGTRKAFYALANHDTYFFFCLVFKKLAVCSGKILQVINSRVVLNELKKNNDMDVLKPELTKKLSRSRAKCLEIGQSLNCNESTIRKRLKTYVNYKIRRLTIDIVLVEFSLCTQRKWVLLSVFIHSTQIWSMLHFFPVWTMNWS